MFWELDLGVEFYDSAMSAAESVNAFISRWPSVVLRLCSFPGLDACDRVGPIIVTFPFTPSGFPNVMVPSIDNSHKNGDQSSVMILP